MNRFKLDEKEAGVHQIYLIDAMQDPGSPKNAENEISWCSFYILDDSNSN
jgi:hypothetical protein